ncbi:glycosyltransferase family 22 protein [Scleroderma citrinum Foug A]|uniref:Mannosyltransferase n=1 Tax=Scleroderma citrinum Foug A TaxID=1036808 RepID=A0A0C3E8F5_9AGAM|nr:glycosyltransferase family 22 protein [Scleroderma citrinum Foug A]
MVRGILMDLLILAISWAYVFLAPYSKVEESFNLHATHDVLMYSVRPELLTKYDHKAFPGAVPRTFIASILLGWLTPPIATLGVFLGLVRSKMDLQTTLRLVLASLNSVGLILIRHAVSKRFGRPTSWLFVLLTLSQFHIPFWMSRTVPNMFALLPVNLAYFALYNRAPHSNRPSKTSVDVAVALLVFTAVVFRSEVTLLLAPLALQLLIQGHITLLRLIKVGLITGVASVGLTVAVDSYFWDQWPLWPELYGLYFNVYLGKSAEWGTSSSHTYFTTYLPKLLLGAGPLAVLGATLDHRIRSLLVAPTLFVLFLSALGHKEWRFVMYVVPLANIAAARGMRWLVSRKRGFVFRHFTMLVALCLLFLSFMLTFLSTKASMTNYPGGIALAAFNERYAGQESIHVHISNLAAQSGASLFLHEHAPPFFPLVFGAGTDPAVTAISWTYNKTEGLTPAMLSSSGFTHLIAESPEIGHGEWNVVDRILGFQRWKLNEQVMASLKRRTPWDVPLLEWTHFLEMEMTEKLWILERSH